MSRYANLVTSLVLSSVMLMTAVPAIALETTSTAPISTAPTTTVAPQPTNPIIAPAPVAPTVDPIRPLTVAIPDVRGAHVRNGSAKLAAAGFRIVTKKVYSNRKRNVIYAQSGFGRAVPGSTITVEVAKSWPNGFRNKRASDRFWRPIVTKWFSYVDKHPAYKGRYKVNTTRNVNLALKAIWGESRGNAYAGKKHRDPYKGLLQMNRGYGSLTQRLDPVWSIIRVGRGIKQKGTGWFRSRWSTI